MICSLRQNLKKTNICHFSGKQLEMVHHKYALPKERLKTKQMIISFALLISINYLTHANLPSSIHSASSRFTLLMINFQDFINEVGRSLNEGLLVDIIDLI